MDQVKAITVNNITKIYKIYEKPADRVLEALHLTNHKLCTDFLALSNVSFTLNRGEILGIMGRNGSGKSTLLKIITGVLTPTYGTVNVEGKLSSLLELGAGFNMEYSGVENIYFYCTLMGFSNEQTNALLPEIIAFAEIDEYINQPVKTYSSGMFARLAFSCAIHVDPDILIVDEILSVGDIRFQAKCFNRFKKFKSQGMTIIYVGHDISIMRTFCDICMWIDSGKIVVQGDPLYVSSKYVEFMYVEDNPEVKAPDMEERVHGSSSESDVQSDEAAVSDSSFSQREVTSLFPDSIAHWGSCVGLIRSVEIRNEKDILANHFSPYESITISILFVDHARLDYEDLSVAVSIKNREGLDLIVKTTYDEKLNIKKASKHTISFSLKTALATGDYYLVAALENRKNAAIMYYEYIEGAKYFKVYTSKRIFGVYDVNSAIDIISQLD